MRSLVVLALVGLTAQLVDGALGMGYGMTSTSLLLLAGVAPASASASVHLAEIGTALAAGVSHWRFGNIDWHVLRRIALPGALGAFLGATVLSSLSTAVAAPWMAAILFTLGVLLLARFARPLGPGRRTRAGARLLAPLGLVAGFVDATGGGGWGPVATPSLLAHGHMEPRKVIGSVGAAEVIVAIAASVGFVLGLGRGGFLLPMVGALLLGGLIAAPVAAWLVRIMPAQVLGVVVGGMILLTNARVLLALVDPALIVWVAVYAGLAVAWLMALTLAVRVMRRVAPTPAPEPQPAPV
ncbi:sulfite exporter TauE/SafE family protein [Pilimelia columellifera]|uniref:Probable membrane transporter protein n=1 Tax=Pilimelia columellifera subsp. columellifera TaxID=706583 RepID=A0ABN3N9K7_9ACTN